MRVCNFVLHIFPFFVCIHRLVQCSTSYSSLALQGVYIIGIDSRPSLDFHDNYRVKSSSHLSCFSIHFMLSDLFCSFSKRDLKDTGLAGAFNTIVDVQNLQKGPEVMKVLV